MDVHCLASATQRGCVGILPLIISGILISSAEVRGQAKGLLCLLSPNELDTWQALNEREGRSEGGREEEDPPFPL